MSVPAALARLVTARAAGRCEYCGLAQAGQEAKFHIDHIVPQSSGGPTDANNLALACVSCSLRKAARQMALDPLTRVNVPIFNPRQQIWTDHFGWQGVEIVGQTPTGRAAVTALEMNRPLILAIREEEARRGGHPRPA